MYGLIDLIKMLGLNTSPFPLNWIEEEDEEERKWEKKKNS